MNEYMKNFVGFDLTKTFDAAAAYKRPDYDEVASLEKGYMSNFSAVTKNSTRVYGTIGMFADEAASELTEQEVWTTSDMYATGVRVNTGCMRTAGHMGIAPASLHQNIVHRNANIEGSFPRLSAVPTADELKMAEAAEQKSHDNDFIAQAIVDDPKKANGVSKLVKYKSDCSTLADIARHSGEKKAAYRDKEGKLVIEFKKDYRSPEYKNSTNIARWLSGNFADRVYKYVSENTDEFDVFTFDDDYSDGYGKSRFVLTDKACEFLMPSEFTTKRLTLQVKEFQRFSVGDAMFKRWNESLEVKLDVRSYKETYSGFDLVEVLNTLYKNRKKSAKYCGEDKAERRNACLEDMKKLVEMVTLVSVDMTEFTAWLSNCAVLSALPSQKNGGVDMGAFTGDRHVVFDNNKMVKFRDYFELFGDLWASAIEVGDAWQEEEAAARKARIEELIALANEKRYDKKTERHDFTPAVFNSEEQAALDELGDF